MPRLFYIKKIVRDDKLSLAFDQNEMYLDEENSLLTLPGIETTSVEYTEANGGEMLAQRLESGEQTVNGIIIPKNNNYWTLRSRLVKFFQPNHTFFFVYEKRSGDQFSTGDKFKTGTAWIEEALQVPPQPTENYSKWTVTLRIGTAGLQEYTEDESGEETYAHSVEIGLTTASSGGETWDEYGQVWDSVGSVWESGDGGLANIDVGSTERVYPLWVIQGPAVNPSLRNNTTNTEATYTGTIASGQTLTVNFSTGTAVLDNVVVTHKLAGEFRLAPGQNTVGFDIDSGSITTSTIKWNNYI